MWRCRPLLDFDRAEVSLKDESEESDTEQIKVWGGRGWPSHDLPDELGSGERSVSVRPGYHRRNPEGYIEGRGR